jgi:hypothetical protein
MTRRPPAKKKQPTVAIKQMELNFTASAGITVVNLPDGNVLLKRSKIITKGSTTDAARVLGKGRDTIVAMILAGEIDGWKDRKGEKTHWSVNMASVYSLRDQWKARQRELFA